MTVIALCASLLACGEEAQSPEGACVQGLDLSCQPLYEPRFEEIFARTLQPGCGIGGASCHSTQGQQAGLVLAEVDAAHAALVGADGADSLVVPGDPACSELVRRIEAVDLARVMPPGARLSQGERCAIERWIAEGAAR